MAIIDDLIQFETLSREIKRLEGMKAKLSEKIVDALGMQELEGQKQQLIDDKYTLQFRRAPRYNIRVDEYEAYCNMLPSGLNPVEQVSSYKLDTKKYREILPYASEGELDILDKIIEKKLPAMPTISIITR